jgi:putative hydrolase of the HAD superfamily
MSLKAIILDLDNTVYPVSSIGQKLFSELFSIIEANGSYVGNIDEIKTEIMRTPFQLVAKRFKFGPELTSTCQKHLSTLTYNDVIEPFSSYPITRKLNYLKFLVTTGFTQLQQSKINKLSIENDFDHIFIIDPDVSTLTKKDVFVEIMKANKLSSDEILVVGDDLNSEIKAGNELGIKTVLYDYLNLHTNSNVLNVITDFYQLEKFI